MRLKLSYFLAVMVVPLMASAAQAANPEHLAQLLKTKECNGCDLSGADLVGADLAGAKLQGANLNAANLAGIDLSRADLTRASLVGSNLVGANLQQATLSETTFVYANLALAQLSNALVEKADFQVSNLTGANLQGATVSKSTFVGANVYNLKAGKSLYTVANRNIFTGKLELNALNTATKTEDRSVIQPAETFESGGSPSPAVVVRRRYRIPLWIGKPERSSAGTRRLHDSENSDLMIDIW